MVSDHNVGIEINQKCTALAIRYITISPVSFNSPSGWIFGPSTADALADPERSTSAVHFAENERLVIRRN